MKSIIAATAIIASAFCGILPAQDASPDMLTPEGHPKLRWTFLKTDINVDGVEISIPAPGEKLAPADETSLKQMGVDIPEDSRLLCAVLPEDDETAFKMGSDHAIGKYYLVMAPKDPDDTKMGPHDFSNIVAKIKNGMNGKTYGMMRNLLGDVTPGTVRELGEPLVMGSVFGGKDVHAACVLVYGEKGSLKACYATISAVMEVKKRLIFVNYSSKFESMADIDELVDEMKAWTVSISESNKD